jgi:hypothetical protein
MDAYDIQARFAPAVFAALPLILLAIAVVPGLGEMKIAGGTIAGILIAVLPFVATRIARSAGRVRQAALFTSWGGIATTAMLRYRDARLNPQTKRIYRQRLSRLGGSFPIPDEHEEQDDPDASDIKIGAAMDEIRRLANQRGVKQVHRENINYGAARNAYGLKPFGLALCLASLVTLVIVIALRGDFSPTPLEIITIAIIAVIGAVWIFACTAGKVGQHGEAYALALFESIETLAPPGTRSSTRRGS